MWSQPDTTNESDTQTSRLDELSVIAATLATSADDETNQHKRKTITSEEKTDKKQRGETGNSVSTGSCGGLNSPEMTREASLRAMQLIRLRHPSSSESVTNMGIVSGGSESSLSSSSHSQASSAAERQRLFARLVHAASVAPEPSYIPQPQHVSAALPNVLCGSFASQQSSRQLSCHSRNYGVVPPTMPNGTWDQTSPDVTQYLQYQAFKRFQQQQQQQQQHRRPFTGLASPAMTSFHRSMSGAASNMIPFHNGGNNEPVIQGRRRFVSDDGSTMSLMPPPTPTAAPYHHVTPNMMRPGGHHAIGNKNGHTMLYLPAILARPEDALKVSSHQVLLRHQIEAFQASEEDISTHTRGRNKPIKLGQVGIRCRHCAHLPVLHRQKGSTYFPASMLGLYQAAQNMSTTHVQCGLCSSMPVGIKTQFADLMSTKVSNSGAGRPYWAESAKKMGLVNTEDGIFFVRDLPPGARLVTDEELLKPKPTSNAKKAAQAQAQAQALSKA